MSGGTNCLHFYRETLVQTYQPARHHTHKVWIVNCTSFCVFSFLKYDQTLLLKNFLRNTSNISESCVRAINGYQHSEKHYASVINSEVQIILFKNVCNTSSQ